MVALHGGQDHADRGLVIHHLELGCVLVAAGSHVSSYFFVLYWLAVRRDFVHSGGLDWRG